MRALLTSLVLVSSLALAACGSSSDKAASSGSTASSSSKSSGGACSYPSAGEAAKKVDAPPTTPTVSGSVAATITLNAGAVPVTLDAASAPCTVNSFESLAKQHYFDDTPCHRLVTAGIYVLQCGDPSGTGSGGPGYSFADELSGAKKLGGTYPAGTLAMANAGADTNGSQFFIVYADSPLPPSYTVFGQVSAAGLAVVKAIAAKGEDDSNGPGDGAPKDKVTIQSVS